MPQTSKVSHQPALQPIRLNRTAIVPLVFPQASRNFSARMHEKQENWGSCGILATVKGAGKMIGAMWLFRASTVPRLPRAAKEGR